MSKKVFITRRIPDVGLDLLKDKGYSVEVNSGDILKKEELIEKISKGDFDAVLCLLTDKIDKDVFSASANVKIFSNYASGFDNIDIDEAKERGVAVANSPAIYSAESVAQFTISLVLALATRIVEANTFTKDGLYKGWDPMLFVGTEVKNKTIGLIGAGRIGQRVAEMARGIGMNVVYFDVVRNEVLERSHDAKYFDNPEDLLKVVDFVSLHVPLLPTTKHLINKERLSIMKQSAFLINTARGPIVDEQALFDALKSGKLAGAGLDVFENEPVIHSGLKSLPNVIMSPHIASATAEARDEMAILAVTNIIECLEGRSVTNLLTK